MREGRGAHKTDSVGDRLATAIRDLLCLVHGRTAGDTLAIMHQHHLTLPQVVTLYGLRVLDTQPVCAIARTLNLSRAATSHLVDRLVQERLVDRIEDPNDRRQKNVTVSERGRMLLAQLDEARHREFQSALNALSRQTREQLVNIVDQINTHLRGHS